MFQKEADDHRCCSIIAALSDKIHRRTQAMMLFLCYSCRARTGTLLKKEAVGNALFWILWLFAEFELYKAPLGVGFLFKQWLVCWFFNDLCIWRNFGFVCKRSFILLLSLDADHLYTIRIRLNKGLNLGYTQRTV